MFELRHLQVFREVARLGSLSAAAESLAYTQPAVSQQMAALERRAGLPLLLRTTRGARLTDAGEALLRHAESILAEQTLAARELEAIAGLRGGRVRMAAFPTAAVALVPAAVSLFSARYPDVELSVLEAEPEEAVPMLRAGELEVAIVAARNQPDGFGDLHEGVDLHHLFDEPRYALLSPEHRLARRKRLRLQDLAQEVRIELARTPIRQGRIYLAPGPEPAPREPRISYRSDDINVVQAMVAVGAGIAVVPELALTNLRSDITVHNLGRSAPMRTIAAATVARVHRTPATLALVELLSEVSEAHLATRKKTMTLAT
ncbi:MAG: LysR family transcriptional regulator [Solirubrobacterales bacterium]|nr:LysR family transcriptional regulator [Solirubrobacterales bacterium]